MSQADIPHGAETEARLGNRLFVAGIALYLIALAVCYAVLGIDSERGGRAFGVLIGAPLGFTAIAFILLQVAVLSASCRACLMRVGLMPSLPQGAIGRRSSASSCY
jgi:hypothetical protein